MSADLFSAIDRFARANNTPLDHQWNADLRRAELGEGVEALFAAQSQLGWSQPLEISGRPRADQFPLLVHDPHNGWSVAMQWMGEREYSLAGRAGAQEWSEDQRFFLIDIPDPLSADDTKAISIFARAIKRRGRVLLIAGLATVFANILTLATSLYGGSDRGGSAEY